METFDMNGISQNSEDTDTASNIRHVIEKEFNDQLSKRSTGLWSYYADYMVDSLFDHTILLLENGVEKPVSK